MGVCSAWLLEGPCARFHTLPLLFEMRRNFGTRGLRVPLVLRPTNYAAGPERRGESLDFLDLDFGLHFFSSQLKQNSEPSKIRNWTTAAHTVGPEGGLALPVPLQGCQGKELEGCGRGRRATPLCTISHFTWNSGGLRCPTLWWQRSSRCT